MEWYKDYSKVIGILMFVGGLALVLVGQEEVGIPLLAAASGVALGKTGGTKVAGALLLCLLIMPGCQSGMIHVSALEPALEGVIERHDTYVKADPGLSESMKALYLRTTELLKKLIEEAKK